MMQKPDTQEFSEFYSKEWPSLYKFLRYSAPNDQVAEDVLSESFLKAWRARDKWPGDSREGRAWLIIIAKRTLIDYYRKNKKEVLVEDIFAPSVSPTSSWINSLDLSREINKLPPEDRYLLALKFAGDYSHDEIARVLKISSSNVSTRLARVLKKLSGGLG